jgi:DNA mismatch repair protein MutL
MTSRIHVLDEKVINRIAAGEVVERPFSVVKELVENSLDAGATTIRIEIEKGGAKLIRVSDNGAGMSHDDAFLALERHATSKVRTEQDIVGVATMGFRGEALASIAAVSKLKLMTADGEDPAGTEILVDGGVLRNSTPVGMSRGTIIEIAHLFYNVPARRKFLKKPETESDHVRELVLKFALAHPTITWEYGENGKIKIDAPPVGSTLDRIHTIYSKEVRDNLIEVDYAQRGVHLHGYVGKPPYARSTNRSILTFVNGRIVKHPLLNSAIGKAFANLIDRGRYPLAMLFLELEPESVDVNVHPQKTEVAFRERATVYNVIVDGVYEALTGAPYKTPPDRPVTRSPRTNLSDPQPRDEEMRKEEQKFMQREYPWAKGAGAPEAPTTSPAPVSPSPPPLVPPSGETPPDPLHRQPASPAMEKHRPGHGQSRKRTRFSELGILGALPDSFVVLYDERDLIVLDHHAAHERILFEDLKASVLEERRAPSQELLTPVLVQFSAVEARAFANHLDLLGRAGFHVEEFGQQDFVVKAIPSWITHEHVGEFCESLAESMLELGVRGDAERFREEFLKTMACHSATKESRTLKPEEIRALLRDLDRIGSIESCPHGRPILTRFDRRDIRKKLGRK